MSVSVVVAVVVALVLGFFAGFFTFKRSLVWCPACGGVKRCRQCPPRSWKAELAAGITGRGRPR
jgi:hypothetical protein